MTYGYMGTILRIDLSRGSIVKEPLDAALREQYIGGVGFATRILYDELKPGTDPLSADNLLIFTTGPLSGTLAPKSGRVDVAGRSAVNGMFGACNGGGDWAPELKFAGYDAIIFMGKASHPVFLWIDDENVEIRDAHDLWGLDTWATADRLESQFPGCQVVSVGPAGENMAGLASITVGYHHSASKGLAAVMGSKRLKAIAVRGSQGVRIAHPDKLEETAKELLQTRLVTFSHGGKERDYRLASGDLGAKNFQQGLIDHWADLDTEATKQYARELGHSCFNCPTTEQCCTVKSGKYAGTFIGDLHGSGYRGWGAAVALNNLPAIYKCLQLCEQLGLDFHGTATTVGFAMELYQRGIISQKDAGGLKLDWGNEDAAIEFLHMIAHREGLGDVFADGTFKAAQRIGKGAMRYAMHVGGATLPPYEYRSASEVAHFDRACQLGTLTCPRGGDNLRSTHLVLHYLPGGNAYSWGDSSSQEEAAKQFVEGLDMPEEVKRQVYGSPPRVKRMSYEGKPALVFFAERMTTLHNMLGLCFIGVPIYGPSYCSRFLSAIAGVEMSPEQLLEVADKIFTLQWAFNAREGMTIKKMDLPIRFYEDPIPDGPSQGDVLSRETVAKAMSEYYQLRRWDEKTGLPTQERLKELGLNEVIKDFKSRSLLD